MADAFTIKGKIEVDTSGFQKAMGGVSKQAQGVKEKLDGVGQKPITPKVDTTGIRKGIPDVEGMGEAADGVKEKFTQTQTAVGSLGSAVKKLVGVYALKEAASALMGAAKKGIEYNAKMERYEANYKVMLGDEAKAQAHVNELRDKASKTPFSMEDLASASQTLLSFGADSESVMDKLQMLGDISLGDSGKLQSLTLAFSQMSSVGKLMGQDLLQMINAGFNPLQVISEKTGASIGDLKEAMGGGKGSKEFQKQIKEAQKEVKKFGDNASDGAKMLAEIGTTGAISSEMVEEAFRAATSEGGRFYKGMETASTTMNGQLSTLGDNFSQLLGNVFEPLSSVIGNGILPMANGLVSSLNNLFTDKDTSFTITAKAEIDAAMTTLTGLDEKVQSMKNDYTLNEIEASVKLANAESLATELQTLFESNAGAKISKWSNEDIAKAKELTASLVEIYPELEKYAGSEGIINAEKTAVHDLVLEYGKLAKAKRMNDFVEELKALQTDAEIQVEYLNTKRGEMVQQKQQHEQNAEDYDTLAWAAASAQQTGIGLTYANGQYFVNEENLAKSMAVLAAYREMSGGGVKELTDYAEKSGVEGLNLSELFDENGGLRSSEDILSKETGMESLYAAVEAIAGLGREKAVEEETASEAYTAAIEELDKSVAEGEKNLQKAKEDVAIAEKVQKNLESSEAVEAMSETVEALTGEAQTVEIEADTAQSMTAMNALKREIDSVAGTYYVNFISTYTEGAQPPGHAVGLDYVPYDNYLSRLHKGEAVLTKAEADIWRKEGSRFDMRGMESVTVPITINGNVDDPFAFADRVRDAFETMRWMA